MVPRGRASPGPFTVRAVTRAITRAARKVRRLKLAFQYRFKALMSGVRCSMGTTSYGYLLLYVGAGSS